MLYGQYRHNVDAKGRLSVPAKWRDKLGDTFMAAAVIDPCICLYSMAEWDKLMAGLNEMPMTKARRLQRYLSANAVDVTVDAQGRILIPKHLLDYAGLTKETVVIGAGNHAELWHPDEYITEITRMTPTEIESEFAELGF